MADVWWCNSLFVLSSVFCVLFRRVVRFVNLLIGYIVDFDKRLVQLFSFVLFCFLCVPLCFDAYFCTPVCSMFQCYFSLRGRQEASWLFCFCSTVNVMLSVDVNMI